jgi:hypothetical protein
MNEDNTPNIIRLKDKDDCEIGDHPENLRIQPVDNGYILEVNYPEFEEIRVYYTKEELFQHLSIIL